MARRNFEENRRISAVRRVDREPRPRALLSHHLSKFNYICPSLWLGFFSACVRVCERASDISPQNEGSGNKSQRATSIKISADQSWRSRLGGARQIDLHQFPPSKLWSPFSGCPQWSVMAVD